MSLACLAPLLAVCRASIRAEMPGDVATFARPWRGKQRVCERHKRLLTDQRPSSTHADTLHDVQSSQPRAALVDEPRARHAITLTCASTSMRGMKMRSPWACRDGCAREVDCYTLRVLPLQVYGQQHTLLCDNDSAAGRGRPLVILCAPAAPGSPGVSSHLDTHRVRIERR